MSQLEAFAQARAHFVKDADALRSAFFYFSPANVLPKIALGKIEVVALGDGWALLSPDGTPASSPPATRGPITRPCCAPSAPMTA